MCVSTDEYQWMWGKHLISQLEITEKFCYYPPPHWIASAHGDHGKILPLPPPTESRRLLETTEKTKEIQQAQLGSSAVPAKQTPPSAPCRLRTVIKVDWSVQQKARMYYVTIYWTSEDCDGQAILTLHLSVGQVILFPYFDHCNTHTNNHTYTHYITSFLIITSGTGNAFCVCHNE